MTALTFKRVSVLYNAYDWPVVCGARMGVIQVLMCATNDIHKYKSLRQLDHFDHNAHLYRHLLVFVYQCTNQQCL
jgi:hypothetical protein